MKNKRNTGILLFWYGLSGFLILGYILLPFLHTVMQAFRTEDGYGWETVAEFFTNPNQRQVIKNTVLLGVSMVCTCGFLGIALALYMTFLAGRRKKAVHVLLLSPMMLPGVITVISFIQLYGESGMVTKLLEAVFGLEKAPWSFEGFGAILFVITYTQYVYFYLNVYVALKYIDYSAVEAARSLGASRLQIFTDVIWPVIRPAVITSAVLTFASGVSAFSAPNLMGGGFKVLSTQIVRAKANNHMEMASIQALTLFFISVCVMVLLQMYSRRFGDITGDRIPGSIPGGERRGAAVILCRILVFAQLLLILLPIVSIVYLSFVETGSIMKDVFPHAFTLRNYGDIFRKPRVFAPVKNSLVMSLMAAAAGVVLTVPSAFLTVRRAGRTDGLLRVLLMLPSAMPASLLGINLINAFNRRSVFALGQSLVGGFYILPAAYTITALPLLLGSAEIAVRGVQRSMEEASESLGAGAAYTFAHVLLPNIAPGVLSGAVLVFIRTVGEYTMSALLYGVHNRPVSISIITNMQEYHIGISLAYGVLVIAVCCAALALVMKLDRKRFL